MAVLSSVILFLTSVCMCIQSFLSPWLNSRGPVKKFCAGPALRLQHVGNATSCAPDSTQHELCDWTHYLGLTTGATYNMTNVRVFKAAQARRAYFFNLVRPLVWSATETLIFSTKVTKTYTDIWVKSLFIRTHT